MAHHFRPVLAAGGALAASALAILLALWAQQRRHGWLYQPAPRFNPELAGGALAAGALAVLVAWWAQQQHRRWLYQHAPRKRPRAGRGRG